MKQRLHVSGLALFTALVAILATTSDAAAQTSSGQHVYATNCASCHQANGQGVSGTFPPLANNSFVTGNPTPVINVVLNGKTGPITVNGKNYNGQMPAWKSQLKAAQIAAVITYIRSSWGNHAGAVTTASVTKAGVH